MDSKDLNYWLDLVNADLRVISNDLASALEAHFSASHNSGSYNRTGALVEAFKLARGAIPINSMEYQAEIYNVDALTPMIQPGLNRAMNVDNATTTLKDGTYLPEAIPWLLDQGFRVFGKRVEGVHYFRNAIQASGVSDMTSSGWQNYVESLFENAFEIMIQNKMNNDNLGFQRLANRIGE